MKNAIIAALVVALALSATAVVLAQAQPTARLQLRIWERSEDPSRNYLSVRPEGEGWRPGTPPLLLEDGYSPDGRYRYGDFAIETAVPEPRPALVEVIDIECSFGRLSPVTTMKGRVHNVTDATLSGVRVEVALRDFSGVEVAQTSASLHHGISPWGKRAFAVSFYGAAGIEGTCHVVGIDYDGAVRHDVPPAGERSPATGAVARPGGTATVHVRLWENVEDPSVHYISTRPEGGSWSATERLAPLTQGTLQGKGGPYRYRDVWVNATLPQPLPAAVELVGVECIDHVHPNGKHRLLLGSLRNNANATLTDVVITAALVNPEGVEVLQLTDEVAGPISPGGERSFRISFLPAPNVPGSCPILGIEYEATVQYEVPIP